MLARTITPHHIAFDGSIGHNIHVGRRAGHGAGGGAAKEGTWPDMGHQRRSAIPHASSLRTPRPSRRREAPRLHTTNPGRVSPPLTTPTLLQSLPGGHDGPAANVVSVCFFGKRKKEHGRWESNREGWRKDGVMRSGRGRREG